MDAPEEMDTMSPLDAIKWIADAQDRMPDGDDGEEPVERLARLLNMNLADEIVPASRYGTAPQKIAYGLGPMEGAMLEASMSLGFMAGWVARQGGGPEL